MNDVTAVDLLRKDKSFEQWARAKSFDTFGVFGPVIATGLDPMKLSVKTILNGKERQNYPVADMFFPPHKLVAAISKDVTLMPGDIIACGTSLGAGTMGDAHNVVDIVIDALGTRHEYHFVQWHGIVLSAGIGFLSSLLGIGGGIIQVPAKFVGCHSCDCQKIWFFASAEPFQDCLF